MQLALLQDTSPAAGETEKIARAVVINGQKRVEHRRHENGTATVDFRRLVEVGRIGLVLDPLVQVAIEMTDGIAQGPVRATRVPELRRELSEQVLAAQVAFGLRDLMRQHFREAEMLKQRDDIRKPFVEGKHV